MTPETMPGTDPTPAWHDAAYAQTPTPNATAAMDAEAAHRTKADWRYQYLKVSDATREAAEALATDGRTAAARVASALDMSDARGAAGSYLSNTSLLAMRRVLEEHRLLRAALASARPQDEASALMDVRHIAASSPLRVTHPHLCGALDSIILRIDAGPDAASARPAGAEAVAIPESLAADVLDEIEASLAASRAMGHGAWATLNRIYRLLVPSLRADADRFSRLAPAPARGTEGRGDEVAPC